MIHKALSLALMLFLSFGSNALSCFLNLVHSQIRLAIQQHLVRLLVVWLFASDQDFINC